MKVAILFCLIAAASAGQPFLGAAPYGLGYAGVSTTGESVVQRQEDGIGNYAFGFSEQGVDGGTSQQEAGDVYGRKQGSYSLGVVDGRQRRVDWVADEFGFRASVKTNEQGTAPSNPADALIDSAAQGVVAHHAPVQAPIAAPIVAQRPIVSAPIAIPRPVVAQPLVHAAPVTKVFAHQPIVQQAIAAPVHKVIAHQPVAIPRPVAYNAHVAHAAPLVGARYGLGLGYGLTGLGYGLPAYSGLAGYGYGLNHGYGLNYGLGYGWK